MYELDLSVKDLPACRTTYKAGDSYCALGKVMVGVGVPIPIRSVDGTIEVAPETTNFVAKVQAGLGDPKDHWANDIHKLNDSLVGSLRNNHERAFRLAVERCLQSGVVTLKGMPVSQYLKEGVTA